jgi:hypothetical protein
MVLVEGRSIIARRLEFGFWISTVESSSLFSSIQSALRPRSIPSSLFRALSDIIHPKSKTGRADPTTDDDHNNNLNRSARRQKQPTSLLRIHCVCLASSSVCSCHSVLEEKK